ncbi:MAG TPA: SPOR domain-containing protein [Xanthobacteraceae bacterium]|jgi:hypothetical protein
MADDTSFRSTRPGNPYARADRSARPSDDPLAELARLIGKNDPYAEFGLSDPHADQQEESDAPSGYVAGAGHVDRHHRSRAQEKYEQQYEPQHEEGVPQYDEPSGHSPAYYQGNHDLPSAYASSTEEWVPDEHYNYQDSRFQNAGPQGAYADSEAYGEQDAHGTHPGYDHPGFHEDGDQIYDDPPRARRHGGLATALALVGCAVLGTAGAYAYRSYHGQLAATQPPPVITADTSTPTKIVPAPASDPQAGKFMQDRVANAGREQVVSKQEEPIALKDLGTQAAPRVVLPAPVAPAPPAAAPQQSSSPAMPGSSEPKKVHTLSIRPDGADVSGQPVGSATRGALPEVRGTGPLSLAPETAAPPVVPAPRTHTATVPIPPRSESASITGGSSGLLVQLSSQKTESEATASFRSLQAKFPNELGGRRPIIRRADLGAKGIFYRTMVGPFASAQEASEFCASYKAAGGHCVVPSH